VGGGSEERRHPGQRAVAWGDSDRTRDPSVGRGGQKAYGAMTAFNPAEVGAAPAFLASSDSSFMTACEVAVDGGLAQL
jgi:NAD(P)-dependent dehydrogenase (short-subunit alcohol dehydrogenase family)